VRRAVVTSTATVSGIILMLGLKSHASSVGNGTAAQPIGIGPSAPAAGSTSGSTSTAPSTKSTSTTPSTNTGSKVVTGSAADTRYGPVQVKLTFTGTKISNIEVVEYPAESNRDQEINSYALPILNSEAITAQNANINAVSGATYTSEGYVQSLQSAIDQARA
jgi:uncharacterized protein with FMN-binding domain